MPIVHFIIKAIVGFVVVFCAIWAYDTFKTSRLASEQRKVAALSESTSQLRSLQSEHIRYGLQAISMYRRVVEEVYYAKSKLPASNAEIGLDSPEKNRSSKVESLEVLAEGVLIVRLANFPNASGIWLRLVPELPSGNLPMNWKCESNFPDVKMLLPPCSYREA